MTDLEEFSTTQTDADKAAEALALQQACLEALLEARMEGAAPETLEIRYNQRSPYTMQPACIKTHVLQRELYNRLTNLRWLKKPNAWTTVQSTPEAYAAAGLIIEELLRRRGRL